MDEIPEVNGLDISLEKLVPLRERNINLKKNKSFKRILSSIRSVGIIEPFSVYQENGKYVILDGFLRYKACQELGITEVPCIVEDTKEAYTYNSKVNRLSPIQEIRMLREAMKDKSIDESTIADVFGMKSLKYRLGKSYISKLHPSVIKALDNNLISRWVAKEFISVKKERQEQIIADMEKVSDYSISFLRALILKTPEELCKEKTQKSIRRKKNKAKKENLVNQLKQVEERHKFYRKLYQQYTADLLKMCIYIRKLLTNDKVREHLESKHPKILESFDRIVFETVPEE